MPAAPQRCTNDTSPPLCYEESAGEAVIIIPCVLAVSFLFILTLIFCSLHRNKQRAHSPPAHFTNVCVSGQQGVSLPAASPPPLKVQPSLRSWEIPEDSVLEGLQVWHQGRHGPVCKGLLRRRDGGPPTAVVVKTLRDGWGPAEEARFEQRLLFHASVCKHQNVLRMMFCQTERLPVCLLHEACSPGNLLNFLWSLRHDDPPPADPALIFSERSVFEVAQQVAAGLDYLMSDHRLVHGYVAARNILIGPGLSVQVSGLGGAFSSRGKDPGGAGGAPLKWQAPERVLMQLSIDRSDVWSFGILLYELITLGAPPYPDLEPQEVLQKLQGSYRMKRPKNCGGTLYDLMKYCWMWSFKDRPAFSAILKLLRASQRLADQNHISVPGPIHIPEYHRRAGLMPPRQETH
ncbi:hypothetical protein PBY51_001218 [Eleginops maclovinus]|uniref:Protein kinase domain-containing protein n=1 Tax=Eleginops maclovinus TaxID=56733 RepID=A0AAN8ARC5_ELEMC|nr:hypothetical protein PBY51_001218 [Eleginops maclovinus]